MPDVIQVFFKKTNVGIIYLDALKEVVCVLLL